MPQGPELFDRKVSEGYDERNAKFAAVSANLHYLMGVVLSELPPEARVLCAGVGTGAEILGLAPGHAGWRFTAVEPSAAMLDVCRTRLDAAGILDRCDLFEGYLHDLPPEFASFDAVLCILVTQFVLDPEARQAMFTEMASRLSPGGYLINAEISFDRESPEFEDMLQKWAAMHQGDADSIRRALGEYVAVAPPEAIENYLRRAGLPMPVQFAQSLLIRAWYAQKPRL